MKDKPVILVVDDEPQNIELLEAHLVPQGYEIVKAASGEEALEKLSGNQIDLILLDVMMPGIDGFEVTRRVRQDDKHRLLPIILVTALRETEDRVKGIEAGCDDFLSKPFDKVELLARVKSLLQVKAYNDLMNNYRKELESEVARRTKEKDELVRKLQNSEALLKATGKMVKVGGWEVDAETLEVNWTEEIYHIYELPPGHKPPLEEAINYFHSDERQKLSNSIQRSLNAGEAWDMEMRFISEKGNHLWIRAICSPQMLEGKTVRLIGTLQDITARARAHLTA
jgi:DNA-binding response OmpR family regulator